MTCSHSHDCVDDNSAQEWLNMYCISVQDLQEGRHLCAWEKHVSWSCVKGVAGCHGCFLDNVGLGPGWRGAQWFSG